MNFDELLRACGPLKGLRLADPRHSARTEIDRAIAIADRNIRVELTDNQESAHCGRNAGEELLAAAETAISRAPNDADLQIAKAGALRCAGKSSQIDDTLVRALELSPNHFIARLLKEYWVLGKPDFLLYPSWSERLTALHPVMSIRLGESQSVQLVRDGMQLGIAIVIKAARAQFPNGIDSEMRCKWFPMFVKTPRSNIVAHYTLIDDGPDPWKGECFLPASMPEDFAPSSGFWLLHILARIGSCFIVLAEGNAVFYNRRFVIPDISEVAAEVALAKSPARSAQDFVAACQLHMNSFDITKLRF